MFGLTLIEVSVTTLFSITTLGLTFKVVNSTSSINFWLPLPFDKSYAYSTTTLYDVLLNKLVNS